MKNVFILVFSLFISTANADVINGFSVEYDPTKWERTIDVNDADNSDPINSSAEFSGTGVDTILTITGSDSVAAPQFDSPRSGFSEVNDDQAPIDATDYLADNTIFTQIMAPELLGAGTVEFDWFYFTGNDPQNDLFGWLLDGIFTPLSDATGSDKQLGSESLVLEKEQTFGFGMWSTGDDWFGNAIAEVSNFTFTPSGDATDVPEPSTIAFFALLCAFITFNRKRNA